MLRSLPLLTVASAIEKGLPSYQYEPQPGTRNWTNAELGEALVTFFEFYGYEMSFDGDNHVIQLQRPEVSLGGHRLLLMSNPTPYSTMCVQSNQ